MSALQKQMFMFVHTLTQWKKTEKRNMKKKKKMMYAK